VGFEAHFIKLWYLNQHFRIQHIPGSLFHLSEFFVELYLQTILTIVKWKYHGQSANFIAKLDETGGREILAHIRICFLLDSTEWLHLKQFLL